MQSGLLFGYAGLTNGILERMTVELSPPDGSGVHVVATGGHAATIASECPALKIIEPDLTLDGLRRIWERNQTSSAH